MIQSAMILSIRAPWYWHIFEHGKDIENRDWATSYRGPLLIQASQWWSRDVVADDFEAARGMAPQSVRQKWSPLIEQRIKSDRGHIIGLVDLVDCVSENATRPSAWFVGRFGFVLKNPRRFRHPIAFKARLGLIPADRDTLSAINRQIQAAP